MTRKSALKYAGIFLLGLGLLVAGLQAASSGDPSTEWAKSKHANRDTAIAEATVESRGPLAAHCGRCHSEQGFLAWLPQLAKGNIGPITKPDGTPADVPYLTSLGLTKDKVQPITCTACHGEGFALRVADNTYDLPAGFKAMAVGAGALCMTCHNTRNGRITWNAADAGRYTAPHESAQTDIILGKNSYFFDDTIERAAAHALFVGDSCVTCHKVLSNKLDPAKGGHTFEPAGNVCTSCHGPEMKKEFVQEPIEKLLKQVKAAIEKRVLAVRADIGIVRAWDPTTGRFTDNFAIDGKQIKGIDILSIAGQIGFKFTLADGREVYSQVGDIRANVLGLAGRRIFETSDPIVRASWNYLLVEHDGSLGVHNPSFTRDLLIATIKALP